MAAKEGRSGLERVLRHPPVKVHAVFRSRKSSLRPRIAKVTLNPHRRLVGFSKTVVPLIMVPRGAGSSTAPTGKLSVEQTVSVIQSTSIHRQFGTGTASGGELISQKLDRTRSGHRSH